MDLMLMRATRRALPIAERPDTIMQNTSGAMTIAMSLMKPSPSGFILTAVCGHTAPRMIAAPMAMITWL